MAEFKKTDPLGGKFWTTLRDKEKTARAAAAELIDNAFDFGGSRVDINHHGGEGGYIEFVDNGRGMNKEVLEDMMKLGAEGTGGHQDQSASSQHGYGAKGGMAYFGKVFEITTVRDGKEYYVKWDTEQDVKSGEWMKGLSFRDGQSTNRPDGTSIKISNWTHEVRPKQSLIPKLSRDFAPALEAGKKIFINGEALQPCPVLWEHTPRVISGSVDGQQWHGKIGYISDDKADDGCKNNSGLSVIRCHRFLTLMQNSSEKFSFDDIYCEITLDVQVDRDGNKDWVPSSNKATFQDYRLKNQLLDSVMDEIRSFLEKRKKKGHKIKLDGMSNQLSGFGKVSEDLKGLQNTNLEGDDLEVNEVEPRNTRTGTTQTPVKPVKPTTQTRKRRRRRVKQLPGISHNVGQGGGWFAVEFADKLNYDQTASVSRDKGQLTVTFSLNTPTIKESDFCHALYLPLIASTIFNAYECNKETFLEEFAIFPVFEAVCAEQNLVSDSVERSGIFQKFFHDHLPPDHLKSIIEKSYSSNGESEYN